MPRERAYRIAAAVGLGVLAGLLVTGALWAVLRPRPATSPRPKTPLAETTSSAGSVEPTASSGSGTSTATAPTSGGAPASTPATTGGSTAQRHGLGRPGTPAGSPGVAAPTRAARIAYRLDGVLYVSAEDGSGAAQVTASTAGPFSLSPDGATIALVEGETLKLVKTGSGAVVSAGPAEEVTPVWMPDSKAVLFARSVSGHSGAEVWRVGADGAGAVRLGAAAGMAVSADGSVVALVQGPSDTAGGVVWVSRRGAKTVAVKLSGSPTAVGVSADRMWVAMTDAGGANPRIVTAALDGSGERQVAGAPPGVVGRMVAYGDVEVSPDGRYLVFCAGSDDGYSRMYSVRTDGGDPVSLSVRRDDYCRGFSATGEYFYFLEGNAFQGEPTALWRVSPDGTRRFLVVDGAK